MKKVMVIILITLMIIGGFFYLGYYHQDEIYVFYRENILKVKENIKLEKNEYYKDKDYSYIQNTNDFIAKDQKHLLNIFYTIINSGTQNFTFYCDDNYKECTNDVIKLVSDKEILSNINNFVHPFNSFESINASYDEYGQIDLKINKVYTEQNIIEVNNKIDSIIKSKIKKGMTNKQKIKTIHDYIINNGKYATDEIRKKYPNRSYNKANDILIDGVGLCSAYADAMALFLYEFNIDNYKIASNTHIWNLVKINNKWLHLDPTWDDPVTTTGIQKLEDIFFLIDDDELKELKVTQHNYNKTIYKEALN